MQTEINNAPLSVFDIHLKIGDLLESSATMSGEPFGRNMALIDRYFMLFDILTGRDINASR